MTSIKELQAQIVECPFYNVLDSYAHVGGEVSHVYLIPADKDLAEVAAKVLAAEPEDVVVMMFLGEFQSMMYDRNEKVPINRWEFATDFADFDSRKVCKSLTSPPFCFVQFKEG